MKSGKVATSMLVLASLLACASLPAAVPLSWTVETTRAQPATFEAYQGETLTFEAALQSRGQPLEAPLNYSFFWQTNGMGSTYWEAPCSRGTAERSETAEGRDIPVAASNVLFATWLPSYDVGAKVYNCFIGSPSNIYHAAFQLRLRPSPGATPNALPLPTPVIDFAKVRVLNPPWSGGAARPLPKYLHALDFADSYPAEAEEYYRSRGDGKVDGGCSSVRDGGFLYRNFDYPFDDRAEFVVKMSAGKDRFASVGVAQVGTNLTEQMVTSGKPEYSARYKWLPGATVDGVNEKGVACNINITGGAPRWNTYPTDTPIHPLAAVRWVLDHATNAMSAASFIARNIRFPVGWSQNYHYMVSDESGAYIVEDGVFIIDSNPRAVLTNFGVSPFGSNAGSGVERYNLLRGGASITNAWFTNAYRRETNPPWVSDLAEVLSYTNEIFDAWATHPKEYFRGKTTNGQPWWQTVHTSVYDLTNRTLRVSVQEVDDWYVFQVPSAGGTDETKVRAIASEVVAPVASQVSGLQSSKLDKTDVIDPEIAEHYGHAADAKATLDALAGKANINGDPFVAFNANSVTAGDFYLTSGASLLMTNVRIDELETEQKADADDLDSHVEDTNVHVNLTEKETWNAKADAADVRTLNEGYQRLYTFSSGATNANISVTNYPPTAAEAEGRTHFDPSDPDLDFSTVPASMRLDETRAGEKRTVVDTRDFPVWWWFQKAPKLLAAAKGYAEEKCAALFSRLAAWADRTARGLENPAGESTLVIDVPNIWLMTDQTFEKHVAGSNSCWVIRSKNAAVSPNVTTNGFLELTDAFGAPYIRFNKTEATFADPPATGIRYDDEAGEWLITYTTKAKPKGGANLAIQGSADYPGKSILKEEGDELCPAVITWTGSQFNWVMHAKPKQIAGADPNKMFFAAAIEVEGQDYIEYLKPVSFSHIVMPNGKKIAPDVPASASVGSTVEWKVVQ